MRFQPTNRASALWVLVCAWLSASGWILSALGMLTVRGYVCSLGLGAGLLVWTWRRLPAPGRRRVGTCFRQRFGKPYPLAFAILALLVMAGGALHAPNNYDGLAYRVPRVLHWLAEGRWHWIHTDFQRLNTRICGFEWMSAPLLALFRTERVLVIINFACLWLMPGLVYGVLTGLGVRQRVAWYWMWLLPTGYIYLLQAGGIGNDLFGTVFALAAVDFALRSRRSGRAWEAWLSIFAVALMTGAKMSNLPLLLPWGVAMCFGWRVWTATPLRTVGVVLVALGVSFVPTAVLNLIHCGDWTGLNAEPVRLANGAPLFHVWVNVVLLLIQNFVPPIFPWAGAWNQFVESLLPAGLADQLSRYFEPAASRFRLGEMQMEEGAGLGFGLCALLVVCLFVSVGRRARAWEPRRSRLHWEPVLIGAAVWVSLLPVLAKLGLSGSARYLAPYYVPLVVPALAWRGMGWVSRRRWFGWSAAVVFLLASTVVIIPPARPLWPAVTFLRWVGADRAQGGLLKRAWSVYSVYNLRTDGFAPARNLVPAGVTRLGIISFDDPETSLWRPFGTRRILHVRVEDPVAVIRARGIEYILVSEDAFGYKTDEPFDQWLQSHDAQQLHTVDLELRASKGPRPWHLVRIKPKPRDDAARLNCSGKPSV